MSYTTRLTPHERRLWVLARLQRAHDADDWQTFDRLVSSYEADGLRVVDAYGDLASLRLDWPHEYRMLRFDRDPRSEAFGRYTVARYVAPAAPAPPTPTPRPDRPLAGGPGALQRRT